ncbi:hypothetical protein [Acinetobacter phage P577]|uniref:hypothetical protein n=1 Tax=Acinetobacter phage YMC13/03/R2096 TaxID=1560342 RepID=UPI00052AA942|nr:hypothetical protein ACQ36_gp094 [Acinetobacter phage YMC13/03/R2096]AIW02839.1 hypothetical protein BPABA577_01050 [Acinetobacter phage YMC13/03/R2096]WNT46163.1 hypothetical protein [Acinetobacter phage P577]
MYAFICWLIIFLFYIAVWYVVKLYKDGKVGEFFTMMCITMLPIVHTLICKAFFNI